MTMIFNPATQKNEISSIHFLDAVDKHHMRWSTFLMFLVTVLLSILTAHWYGFWGFVLNFIFTFPFLRDAGHKLIFHKIRMRTGCEQVEDPLRYQTKYN